jgi:hypothetical protein
MKKPPRRKISFPLIIFLAIFLLPGLAAGLYGTVMMVVAQGWTRVEANIDKVYADGRRISRSRPAGGRSRGTRKKRSVRRLKVLYSYEWEGDTITNDRVAFLQGFSGRKIDWASVEAKLGDGKKVIAYVNPRRPEKAVLVRSLHRSILFGYLSAVSCFLFFAFIGSVLFGYPSIKFGVYAIGTMIVLYLFFFSIDSSVLTFMETVDMQQ